MWDAIYAPTVIIIIAMLIIIGGHVTDPAHDVTCSARALGSENGHKAADAQLLVS